MPVIVPQECEKPLEYLVCPRVRAEIGVGVGNPFIFAKRGLSFSRTYDALQAVCSKCHLKCPERINSVNTRKYIATMSQVILVLYIAIF